MRQPEQVVASAPARLQRRRVQQRTDVCQRPPQAAVGQAVDQRGALVDRVQAEDHPHRGGLSGAVRPDEAGHQPGADGEGHSVEGQGRAEPLAQSGDDDSRGAHRSWMFGVDSWSLVLRGSRFQLGRSRCDPAETGDLASSGMAPRPVAGSRPRPSDGR